VCYCYCYCYRFLSVCVVLFKNFVTLVFSFQGINYCVIFCKEILSWDSLYSSSSVTKLSAVVLLPCRRPFSSRPHCRVVWCVCLGAGDAEAEAVIRAVATVQSRSGRDGAHVHQLEQRSVSGTRHIAAAILRIALSMLAAGKLLLFEQS